MIFASNAMRWFTITENAAKLMTTFVKRNDIVLTYDTGGLSRTMNNSVTYTVTNYDEMGKGWSVFLAKDYLFLFHSIKLCMKESSLQPLVFPII